MGTRSLIGIVHNNTYKGSYNHFDGYPTGVGKNLQEELAAYKTGPDAFWAAFRTMAAAMRWVQANDQPTEAEREQFKETHQQVSNGLDWYSYLRDHHGSLLKRLNTGIAIDDSTFIKDSLFCEWAYIFDADNEQVLILEGFNKNPGKQWRYAKTSPDGDYYGCSVAWQGTLPEFLSLDMDDMETGSASNEDEEAA